MFLENLKGVLLFHGVEVGIGARGVEALVAVHHGDEVVGLAEVDDVVGIAGEHVDGLDALACDFVVPHFVGAFLAQLDEAVAADDDKGFPLAVVPVLALGDAGLGDVDAHLSAVEGVEEFGERAAGIDVHGHVVDGFLFGQITEVRGHEFVPQAAFGLLHHVEAVGVGCCAGAVVDDVHDVAEGGPVGHGDVAVAAVGGGDGFDAVKLAVVFFAREGSDHLVHEVVDIEEFHLDAAVVDLNGQVVGDVVAEGGHGAVVVGAAPLAEEVGETIDQDAGAGLPGVVEEEFFAGFLALAVFAGAEAAGEGGLYRTGQHHGAAVAVFAQGVEQGGGETEVAGHELFGVLGAVDAGKVEDEMAIPAPCVQLFGRGIDVVFIDGLDGLWEVIPLGLAITDVLELGAEVAAYEAAGAGDEDFHGEIQNLRHTILLTMPT